MLGLILNHASKRGPWSQWRQYVNSSLPDYIYVYDREKQYFSVGFKLSKGAALLTEGTQMTYIYFVIYNPQRDVFWWTD